MKGGCLNVRHHWVGVGRGQVPLARGRAVKGTRAGVGVVVVGGGAPSVYTHLLLLTPALSAPSDRRQGTSTSPDSGASSATAVRSHWLGSRDGELCSVIKGRSVAIVPTSLEQIDEH